MQTNNQSQALDYNFFNSALKHAQAYNQLTSDRAEREKEFWRAFDNYILTAIKDGRCPVVWAQDSAWGVASTEIYQCQINLLNRLELVSKIPFAYKNTQQGLNRDFYRRQGLKPRLLWIRSSKRPIKGVIIKRGNSGLD
jgi:hypothetical protein